MRITGVGLRTLWGREPATCGFSPNEKSAPLACERRGGRFHVRGLLHDARGVLVSNGLREHAPHGPYSGAQGCA